MPAVDLDLGDKHDQQLIDKKVGSTYWFDRLNGKSIRVQLYQQNFLRNVLPEGMSGVELYGEFINCIIPDGCTLMDGADNRLVDVQKDFNDWYLDKNGNPVEPVNKKQMLRDGLSIDPADIPAIAIRNQKMLMKQFDIEFAEVKPIRESWFKVKPNIISIDTQKRFVEMSKAKFVVMEDNGIFDSEPTRSLRQEEAINSKLPMRDHIVLLKGYQTTYRVEGEAILFRDARRSVR